LHVSFESNGLTIQKRDHQIEEIPRKKAAEKHSQENAPIEKERSLCAESKKRKTT